MCSGHDLTHHFYDDRSSLSYGPPLNRMEQGQSLQLSPPPIQQHLTPASTQPQPNLLRVPDPTGSGPRPTIPTLSDLSSAPPSEQALLAAMLTVVNNVKYADYMQVIVQRWPNLSNLLFPQNDTQNAHQSNPSTQQQQSIQPSVSTFQSTNDQPSTSSFIPTPSVIQAPITSSSGRDGAQTFQNVQNEHDESRSFSRKRSHHTRCTCSQTSQTSADQKNISPSSKPPPHKKTQSGYRTATKAAV